MNGGRRYDPPGFPRPLAGDQASRPRRLETLLSPGGSGSSALANLTRAARSHSALLERVQETLGTPLGTAVGAACFKDGTLTLVVRSAVWATHLRLAAPSAIPRLAAACELPLLERLAVRVRPDGAPTG